MATFYLHWLTHHMTWFCLCVYGFVWHLQPKPMQKVVKVVIVMPKAKKKKINMPTA